MADPVKKFLLAERRKQMSTRGATLENQQRRLNQPIPEPRGVELAYRAELVRQQKEINKQIRARLRDNKALADTENSDNTTAFFAALSAAILTAIATSGATAVQKAALKTQAFSFKKYNTPVGNAVGFNAALTEQEIGAIAKSWVSENVALIKNTNARQVSQIETAVLRAVRSGQTSGKLTKELSKIYGKTNRHIKFIADDQISKLVGQLDMAKQTAAGFDGYYWRTMQDKRVRPAHAAREGKYFRWDSPPDDGHPGQPIGCRCIADPAIERLTLTGKQRRLVEDQRARLAHARRRAIVDNRK
jgi:SPP1 gp7 family putative phage head morphogenesis protein